MGTPEWVVRVSKLISRNLHWRLTTWEFIFMTANSPQLHFWNKYNMCLNLTKHWQNDLVFDQVSLLEVNFHWQLWILKYTTEYNINTNFIHVFLTFQWLAKVTDKFTLVNFPFFLQPSNPAKSSLFDAICIAFHVKAKLLCWSHVKGPFMVDNTTESRRFFFFFYMFIA